MVGVEEISSDKKSLALEEVLRSETLLRSDQLRHFLRYICEMEISGRGSEITERSIAEDALGRRNGFVPSEDTIVRNRAHMLRQRLKDFYDKENPHSILRIELPKGSYVPRFVPVQVRETVVRPASRPRLDSAAIGFLAATILFGAIFLGTRSMQPVRSVDPVIREAWGPLVAPDGNPVLVLGLPVHLMVRSFPGGSQPRDAIDVAAPPSVAEFYERRTPRPESDDLHMLQSESLRFGEAMAAITTARTLEAMRVSYQVLPDIAIRLAALRGRNAILIGDPTVIPTVFQQLQRAPLSVEYDPSVRDFVVGERAGVAHPFMVAPEVAIPGHTREIPGLLTVMPSDDTPGSNKRTVLLSCAMSAGCQAAAEFFSSPDSLRELRGRFRQEGIHGFPRAYQVVVKGRTDNVLLISFRYEAHRVLDRTVR